MTESVQIIAEIGVNHNGSITLAKQMVEAAHLAGANAVKFQTFCAEQMTTASAQKADYQKKSTDNNETQFEMLKKLELDEEGHKNILAFCTQRKIDFISSPFDLESINFLQTLELQTYKIPSGEITNLPYLRAIGALKAKLIVSTGMSSLPEIEKALKIIEASGTPRNAITVLHCNSAYPTPFTDVNLMAMKTIQATFPEVSIGFSDHTTGIEVAIGAVALGAQVIEKHFTLDRSLPGPDHKASIEPEEFKAMTMAIRNIEQALGDGQKRPTDSETKNIDLVRKSIVAAQPIFKGDFFTESNLSAKRPGTGLSPMLWDDIIGKEAPRDFEPDEPISLEK